MAVRRKASIKMLRKDKKRRQHNIEIRNDLKKTLKKFQALLTAKNSTEAKAFLKQVFSKLDKAAKKGIIHKNLANRKKSRLAKQLLKAA